MEKIELCLIYVTNCNIHLKHPTFFQVDSTVMWTHFHYAQFRRTEPEFRVISTHQYTERKAVCHKTDCFTTTLGLAPTGLGFMKGQEEMKSKQFYMWINFCPLF